MSLRTSTGGVVSSLVIGMSLLTVPVQAGFQPEASPPVSPTSAPAPAAPADRDPPLADNTGEAEPETLVFLKDGRRFTGLLVSKGEGEINLRINGVNSAFKLVDVARYEVLPPVLDRYRELREAVQDDPEQIIKLAEWLQAREKYELAYTEVRRALEIEPANTTARSMKLLLEEQIVLKQRSLNSGGAGGAGAGVGEPPAEPERIPAVHERRAEVPFLRAEQINLMKVFEIDLSDAPRLVIPREAVEEMLRANAASPLIPVTQEGRELILRKSPVEILDLMFKLQAREFYPRVQVLDQPRSIASFRDSVQRGWLLNACATTQCHGGTEAGRLVLFTRKPGSDAAVYTNLLILDRFRTKDGKPLINWNDPERSPLLHLGLPRRDSIRPHPPVPSGVNSHDAWKPAFRSTSDRAFQSAVSWIKSMYRPRPDYPVEYEPLRAFSVTPAPVLPAQLPPGQLPPGQLPIDVPRGTAPRPDAPQTNPTTTTSPKQGVPGAPVGPRTQPGPTSPSPVPAGPTSAPVEPTPR